MRVSVPRDQASLQQKRFFMTRTHLSGSEDLDVTGSFLLRTLISRRSGCWTKVYHFRAEVDRERLTLRGSDVLERFTSKKRSFLVVWHGTDIVTVFSAHGRLNGACSRHSEDAPLAGHVRGDPGCLVLACCGSHDGGRDGFWRRFTQSL